MVPGSSPSPPTVGFGHQTQTVTFSSQASVRLNHLTSPSSQIACMLSYKQWFDGVGRWLSWGIVRSGVQILFTHIKIQLLGVREEEVETSQSLSLSSESSERLCPRTS